MDGPKPRNTGHQSGVSLVELVTALGIMALVASVAFPQYNKFKARARMSEAKANLKGIHTMQLDFFGDHSRYGSFPAMGKMADGSRDCTSNEIGFEIPDCAAAKIRYRYEVTNPGGPATYRATATGVILEGCATEDVWEMRQDGTLRHTTNAMILCR